MNYQECESCLYIERDEVTGEDYCTVFLDEDDMAKLSYRSHKACPYYKDGDDYTIVKKQAFK